MVNGGRETLQHARSRPYLPPAARATHYGGYPHDDLKRTGPSSALAHHGRSGRSHVGLRHDGAVPPAQSVGYGWPRRYSASWTAASLARHEDPAIMARAGCILEYPWRSFEATFDSTTERSRLQSSRRCHQRNATAIWPGPASGADCCGLWLRGERQASEAKRGHKDERYRDFNSVEMAREEHPCFERIRRAAIECIGMNCGTAGNASCQIRSDNRCSERMSGARLRTQHAGGAGGHRTASQLSLPSNRIDPLARSSRVPLRAARTFLTARASVSPRCRVQGLG